MENLQRRKTQTRSLVPVSENKNIEQELTKQIKQYRTLFEGANDAIFILKGKVFIECNKMTLKMFACKSKDEILQHSPWEFSPVKQPDGERSKTKALRVIGKALKGTPQRFYWQHKKMDGMLFDCEVSLNSLDIDEGTVIQAIVRDVSEKKKDEDLLRRSEENFRRMFEEAPIGMALTSRNSYFLLANRIMTRMFGYSEKELKQLTFKDITHPDHLAGDIHFVNKLIGGELQIYRTEKRYIRKNKEIIWGSLTVTPILNATLEVDHFLVMVEDITERKKNDMMLKESQEQLENFAQHLQTIREEERARVSRALHDDLGQNLSAIRMDAASIIKKLSSCRDTIESKPIWDLAKEMMTIIDATIPVVRKISSDLRPRVLDELGLLSAIEWQVEEFIKRSGIGCEFMINTKTIELKYSRSIAVFRIVQESLTNVMQHSGATKSFVNISENKNSFVICVQDNGSGIRASKITSGKSLGLIEMRERALLIGGNLVIRRVNEQGTEVELTIPKI